LIVNIFINKIEDVFEHYQKNKMKWIELLTDTLFLSTKNNKNGDEKKM
jgi:hypothetical protein